MFPVIFLFSPPIMTALYHFILFGLWRVILSLFSSVLFSAASGREKRTFVSLLFLQTAATTIQCQYKHLLVQFGNLWDKFCKSCKQTILSASLNSPSKDNLVRVSHVCLNSAITPTYLLSLLTLRPCLARNLFSLTSWTVPLIPENLNHREETRAERRKRTQII